MPAATARKRVNLGLRTQHVDYLSKLGERRDISLSRALADLIDDGLHTFPLPHSKAPPKKADKHLCLTPEHLSMLDQWAVRLGVGRMEVARRLIDLALVRDLTP